MKNLNCLKTTVVVLGLLLGITASKADIWYVTENGSGNGASWATASGDLQSVIDNASPGDEIWLSAGTYRPTQIVAPTDNETNATTDKDKAFVITKALKLYGGFAVGSTNISQRDFEANKTILSGDLAGDDTVEYLNYLNSPSAPATERDDNTYHVVIIAGGSRSSNEIYLDGLTISGGNAYYASKTNAVEVNGESIIRSQGGGLYISNSLVTMKNLEIINNGSALGGGGMNIENSTLTMEHISVLQNVIFYRSGSDGGSGGGGFRSSNSSIQGNYLTVKNNTNRPSYGLGGGLAFLGTSSTNTFNLQNSEFYGNYSHGGGSALCGTRINMTNIVVAENAGYGGTIYLYAESKFTVAYLTNVTIRRNYGPVFNLGRITAKIRNSIISENNYDKVYYSDSFYYGASEISHTLFEGSGGSGGSWDSSIYGTDMGGNIDVSAVFEGVTDTIGAPDCKIMKYSPAIDAGSNTYYQTGQTPDLSSILTDVDGNSRIYAGGTVDMGAYEYQGSKETLSGILYVDATGSPNNDGTSWSNAMPSLAKAMNLANQIEDITEIRVAQGTYSPEYIPAYSVKVQTQLREFHKTLFLANRTNSLHIKGGYPTGGGVTANPESTPTILDGKKAYSRILDINKSQVALTGLAFDNAYSYSLALTSSQATVENISISNSGGSAVHLETDSYLILNNSKIENNKGTALYSVASAFVCNNTSLSYSSGVSNVGIWASGSVFSLNNVKIQGNAGGGVSIYGDTYYTPPTVSLPNTMTNVLISDNDKLGMIYGRMASLVLTNTNIINNKQSIKFSGTTALTAQISIRNSIIWGNGRAKQTDPTFTKDTYSEIDISHSLIELSGGSGGSWDASLGNDLGGNIDVAPVLKDYKPLQFSPLIDAGNSALYASGAVPDISSVTTDLDGNARISHGTVDIGAYESQVAKAPSPTGILYVDSTASATNTGSSWADAMPSLADACNLASQFPDITAIYIAKGTYYPEYMIATEGKPDANQSERDKTFAFVNRKASLTIEGGYPTGGGTRDHRANPVVLSGDIGVKGDTIDNAYHVLLTVNCENISFDGITVTQGNGDTNSGLGSGFSYKGYTLYRGMGAGIYNIASTLTFTNLNLVNNYGKYGTGICNDQSTVMLTNLLLKGNIRVSPISTDNAVSAIYERNPVGTLVITNMLATENVANTLISSSKYNVVLTNATISGNRADPILGASQIRNSIIYGNGHIYYNTYRTAQITNSIIDGCWGSGSKWNTGLQAVDGGNNLDVTPVFKACTDIADGYDYSLMRYSPAIDTGSDSFYAPGETPDLSFVTTDLAGNPRKANGAIDMGAFEYQPTDKVVVGNILYVDSTATGDNTGADWANAMTSLALACHVGVEQDIVSEIRIAKGTYHPEYLIRPLGDISAYSNRDKTFAFINRAKPLYVTGGYPSGGGVRDYALNPVVLDGDIGVRGDRSDNVYHVVVEAYSASTMILDGLTITGGNADRPDLPNVEYILYRKDFDATNPFGIDRKSGGGIFHGGNAITVHSAYNSFPRVRNTIIKENRAVYGGGVIVDVFAWPNYGNVLITRNYAEEYGGGIYNDYGNSFTGTNMTISGNYAGKSGGGISQEKANIPSRYYMYNCIIWGNKAGDSQDDAFFNGSSTSSQFINSIVGGSGGSGSWDSYYGTNGGLNLDTDPMFVYSTDPSAGLDEVGDYRLRKNSPAIDAGNNGYSGALTTDLGNNPRIYNTTVDIGAYEYFVNMWQGTAGTDWSNSANWSASKPLADTESLVFDVGAVNDLLLTADETHTVSDIENQSEKIIGIGAGATLKVTGNITQKNSDAILVKAGTKIIPGGTLIVAKDSHVQATVEFVTQGISPEDATKVNQMSWQYFGIPVQSYPAKSMHGAYIRKYNEASTSATQWWTWLDNESTMTPTSGYEISVKQPHTGKFVFSGDLNTSDMDLVLNKTDGSVYTGQHVVSNPYTAGLDIKKNIQFGSAFDGTVYLFHTGTNTQWKEALTEGTGAGQYQSVPQLNAGSGGLPAVIPSMQGFVVKIAGALSGPASDTSERTVALKYDADALAVNTPMKSLKKQSAEQAKAMYSSVALLSGDTLKDRMWIFIHDDATKGFDRGYDGVKLFGNTALAQLYTVEYDGNYQVNTMPDINGTSIYFKAEKGTADYTLQFTHEEMEGRYEQLVLWDRLTGQETDITADGTVYHFQARNEAEAQLRFVIRAKAKDGGGVASGLLEVFFNKPGITVVNRCGEGGTAYVYDVYGRLVHTQEVGAFSHTYMDCAFTPGIYVVKLSTDTQDELVGKIIIN